MAHVTFKGGVFPHKRKRFTREKALEEYRPKGDLVYPLRQHIGGTAVPVVTVGDRVLEGQLLAKASGDISAPEYPDEARAAIDAGIRQVPYQAAVDGTAAAAETDGFRFTLESALASENTQDKQETEEN